MLGFIFFITKNILFWYLVVNIIYLSTTFVGGNQLPWNKVVICFQFLWLYSSHLISTSLFSLTPFCILWNPLSFPFPFTHLILIIMIPIPSWFFVFQFYTKLLRHQIKKNKLLHRLLFAYNKDLNYCSFLKKKVPISKLRSKMCRQSWFFPKWIKIH